MRNEEFLRLSSGLVLTGITVLKLYLIVLLFQQNSINEEEFLRLS